MLNSYFRELTKENVNIIFFVTFARILVDVFVSHFLVAVWSVFFIFTLMQTGRSCNMKSAILCYKTSLSFQQCQTA